MSRSLTCAFFAGAATLVALASAQPVPKSDTSRGELLYATHCIGCHTAQIHWRDRRLATDWASLEAQVRRWQANTGLGWSDEEVGEVARYLNGLYYHFAAPSDQALGVRGGARAARGAGG